MITQHQLTDDVLLLQGHTIEALEQLPRKSVRCVVTSPPYWGLRAYGTEPQIWQNGHELCVLDEFHEWQSEGERAAHRNGKNTTTAFHGKADEPFQMNTNVSRTMGNTCRICGAWRGELGLEPTPELYVAHLVEVFRAVRDVLADDGTLWLNLGDSYAGGKGQSGTRGAENQERRNENGESLNRGYQTLGGAKQTKPTDDRAALRESGIKPKDLVGIPWRVAFALQQPYVVPVCVKSEVDRAWLAAIFDGEGCIGIRRFASYREEKQQVYQDGFVAYTVVTNNDVPLLDRCIEITGYGKAALKQKAESTDGRGIKSRRDSFGWRLDGNKAVDVICAIYPHLIAKRKQAIIAYTLDELNKNGHGSRAVPTEIQEKKAYLKELVNRANQRQDFDLPSWVIEPKQNIEPGWYLRSDIIWHKPNPMPESVTDRPTKSHEYIFLLTKSPRYYYDADAVREKLSDATLADKRNGTGRHTHKNTKYDNGEHPDLPSWYRGKTFVNPETGRNRRSVWTVTTKPFKGAHFATFPPDLIEPCILAGTSERGQCPKCGKAWVRNVRVNQYPRHETEDADLATDGNGANRGKHARPTERNTIGWQPTCACGVDPVPDIVLDPFGGSGTTAEVALRHGRRAILIDLNSDYIEMQKKRLLPVIQQIARAARQLKQLALKV